MPLNGRMLLGSFLADHCLDLLVTGLGGWISWARANGSACGMVGRNDIDRDRVGGEDGTDVVASWLRGIAFGDVVTRNLASSVEGGRVRPGVKVRGEGEFGLRLVHPFGDVHQGNGRVIG